MNKDNTPESNENRITLNLGSLSSKGEGRREFRARFVRAGFVRNALNEKSNIEVTDEALSSGYSKGLFDKLAVFVDHAGGFDYPSVRNLAGVTSDVLFSDDGPSIEGTIRFYSQANGIVELLDEVLSDGESAPNIGLSLSFWPVWAARESADDPRRIVDIKHVESVDVVFQPAADGRFLKALSVLNPLSRESDSENFGPENEIDPVCSVCGADRIDDLPCPICENLSSQSGHKRANYARMPGGGETMSDELITNVTQLPETSVDEKVEDWKAAMSASAAEVMIRAADLPQASKARLMAQNYDNPEAVSAAIQAESEYLAEITAANVVQIGGEAPRGGDIQMGLTGFEQIKLAAEALFAGGRPEKEVQPLSGIRELYTLLSGDYEMTGLFYPDRIRFANVNSSTMAGLVANALNKRVVNQFMEYPHWWTPIVLEEDFSNLQQVKWITLGGVGELPTVAEGAAYTELTWDDQTETADFVKKGGYLGITLETIDKDDTRKVTSAPRALAQAAWLTLAKAISAIFTANSGVGPTMSDSTALFDAGHSNLGTTALSITTFAAARLAMRKQTEVNSSERLGALCAPKYLLVPPDLEITALQILASEQDYLYALANAPSGRENVFSEGGDRSARMAFAKERVIVVDLWTDTNNWAAAGDPMLYPTIGLGFRYGRTPEIFSVASPTAGLMFTNDTMPVKVRFFFATGPMDYRNLYKANVA
jgi:hypothetical protein